ncbi:hypothetical protein M404DRAFT_1001180 [Pisolithus tinctorius Marx 270]|uniref:Uncharacterized protein n=1 Tax=Pisolithus tinctorius Marx 270 TaxID=870435 RepID=A0A0C3P885_PISTI|nr:hypothetical protein M404DRAFT_1001180 [Pisolithus tinctorius Marx 270]
MWLLDRRQSRLRTPEHSLRSSPLGGPIHVPRTDRKHRTVDFCRYTSTVNHIRRFWSCLFDIYLYHPKDYAFVLKVLCRIDRRSPYRVSPRSGTLRRSNPSVTLQRYVVPDHCARSSPSRVT